MHAQENGFCELQFYAIPLALKVGKLVGFILSAWGRSLESVRKYWRRYYIEFLVQPEL